MSNLLLVIGTALAQDCPPDPSTLIAVPGPDAAGVPVDITPKILFNGPCSEDLEVALLKGEQQLSYDSAIGAEYSPQIGWLLDEASTYQVAVKYLGEEFQRWSFTTGNQRAEGSSDTPTQLRLHYAWTDDSTGDVIQHITYELEILAEEERVYELYDPSTRRRVHAGVTSGEVGTSELIDIEFPISFSESEACLQLAEYDHQGARRDNDDCVANLLEPEFIDDPIGCSTAGGVSGGALLTLGLLGLRRRSRVRPG